MAASKKAKSRPQGRARNQSQKKSGQPKKNQTVWSYFSILILALVTLPIVLVAVIFTQRIQPDSIKTFNERNDLVLDVFKSQVSQELDRHVAKTQSLAELEEVITSVQATDTPTTIDLQGSPGEQDQYILFPKGNHRPNENNSPPITFIMINNAFNATRSGETIVEMDNQFLYVTTQIKSNEGKALGALTSSIPKGSIFAGAYQIIQSKVAVQILQSIDQNETTVFQSNGWKASNELTREEKFHDIYILQAHWIGEGHSKLREEIALISFAIGLGAILAMIAGAIAVGLQKAITDDLEIVRDAIIDLFRGKRPANEKFKLKNIAETYENIYDNLRNSATIASTAAPAAPKPTISDSLFDSDEDQESSAPKTTTSKASYSREQYAMEVEEQSVPSQKKAKKNTAAAPSDIQESIFRAYDIRGVYPSELNEGVVEAIGRAIGTEAIAAGTREITIARDGRTTGPDLIKALRKGLKKTGIIVIDIGMVPTPLLYFAAKQLTEGSGVMLTGSHNPPDYNGLKIMIAGDTLYGDRIKGLYTRIQNQDFAKGTGQVIEKDIQDDYESAIIGDIVLSRALKVVVDCGNGVTGVMLPKLFEQLGAKATGLFTEVDGTFPNHSPDPSQPKNMVTLIEEVKKQGADLGLAFDGDGDRVGVITPSGQMVYADKLMMLFAEEVLAANPGQDIIFDVKCSSDLPNVIRNSGGRPVMWKTGHSLIKAKLRETKAPLAGEMSGHIFFNDRWNGFDDALYAAARLLEILSSTTENLDELLNRYPNRIATPELHVEVTDSSKFDIISKLVAEGSFGNGKPNEIDGLRVDFEKGWGLLRASNTTPVLVARFEAESEDVLNMIQGMFRENLQSVAPGIKISF